MPPEDKDETTKRPPNVADLRPRQVRAGSCVAVRPSETQSDDPPNRYAWPMNARLRRQTRPAAPLSWCAVPPVTSLDRGFWKTGWQCEVLQRDYPGRWSIHVSRAPRFA